MTTDVQKKQRIKKLEQDLVKKDREIKLLRAVLQEIKKRKEKKLKVYEEKHLQNLDVELDKAFG